MEPEKLKERINGCVEEIRGSARFHVKNTIIPMYHSWWWSLWWKLGRKVIKELKRQGYSRKTIDAWEVWTNTMAERGYKLTPEAKEAEKRLKIMLEWVNDPDKVKFEMWPD